MVADLEDFDDEAEPVDCEAEPVDGKAEPVAVLEADGDVSVAVVLPGCSVEFDDEESTEDDESVSSAHAGPAMLVANPTPTPSATASVPTRPMNVE